MTYDEIDLCGCSDDYGPCEDHGVLLEASGTEGSDADRLLRLLARLSALVLAGPTSRELTTFPPCTPRWFHGRMIVTSGWTLPRSRIVCRRTFGSIARTSTD